jgi:hypothetical protein
MHHMEREVRRQPDVAISVDLDEWHDSSTAMRKVLSFCGVEELTERALREYNKAYAKMSTSSHVNHDGERAERLLRYLQEVGVDDSLRSGALIN